MTLQLPTDDDAGDARRVPLGPYGQLAFIRSWRALDHGLFLIDYTNARNGRSRAWKYAIVKVGKQNEWNNVGRQTVQTGPATWIPVASVNRGKVQGQEGFHATVFPLGFETMDWYWPKSAKVWHEDREEACRLMLGITEVMYGITFAKS